MTRRSLLIGFLASAAVSGSSSQAGWGRKRGAHHGGLFHLPAPVDEEDDDRVKNGRPHPYEHDGYQGYNLGAFDRRSVYGYEPRPPATTGFPLLRFPLRRRAWR